MASRDRLEELKQELEWRRCAKDPVHFLENYWYISHPAKGPILFKLRKAQRRALRHWLKHRYSLTLKARQIGWTTLVAGFQAWLAYFHEDRNIIDISRTEREAILLLKKTKYGFSRLPDWMKQRGPKVVTDHQQKIVFDNSSQIVSMPSASDPARGESASLIVVDEWAFLPNPEDAWASIEPVADVGGRIIGLSTANGSGNFFHQLWNGAETGANFFKTIFEPWSANEDRDEAWYEAKKRSMLPWQLAQEYPTTPEEAFIKSGRTVFDADELRRTIIPATPTIGHLQQLNSVRRFQWRPVQITDYHSSEPVSVWVDPKPDGVYVIGADVAEGLEHGDFSAAYVVDVSTGDVAAEWHGHISADDFGDELYMLGTWYGTSLIGCEVNNHGLTTVTRLRKLGYKRLYRRRNLNTTRGGPTEQFGWLTTRTSKPLMIDELGGSLKAGELQVYSQECLAELLAYVRDEKGRMSGSPYDDRVMALAIANQMRKHAFAHEYVEPENDYMSFWWWANQSWEPDHPTESDAWVIGGHSSRR